MTEKEMRKYLNQAFYIDRAIKAKRNQIQSLRELAESSTPSTGIKVDGTKQNKLESCVTRMVDLEREIEEDIVALVQAKAEIYKTIQDVPDMRDRTVLELRYLQYMTYEQICDEMGYLETASVSRSLRRARKKLF